MQAIEVAKFINKYIGDKNIQVTHAASYNQLSRVGIPLEEPKQLFSGSKMFIFDTKEKRKVFKDFTNNIIELEKKQ